MKISNKKLDEDIFRKERQEVLAQWPTGKEVDLEEAIAFHKSMPPGKNLVRKVQEAKDKGEIYTVTGMGKATLEEQSELWKYLQDAGQADILGTSVDSFTRVHNFSAAEDGIKESQRTGKSVLNGVPVVNHGIHKLRKAILSVDVPVSLRYGAADPRIIDEIGLAGGHCSTAPDGIYSFWNMNSKLKLEESLRIHQYVMRLAGYYEEKGVPISIGTQGMYDGGALPPSLVSAAILTQVLMYAEQGAKHIGMHYHLRANVVQDVASSGVLQKLAGEYLGRFGHTDVSTTSSVGLSILRYPEEIGSAFAIICYNTLMAKICGAQTNDIRTPAEAVTIPTKEDIATSLRCAKMMSALLKQQKIEIDHKAVQIEAEREEVEVRQILDRVIELGEGDVAVGLIRAVQAGVLDNPFSTNPNVACKVLGVKDSESAVRYLDTGNLPFTRDIIDFHKAKVAEREKRRGKVIDYETVISDIMSISKGFLMEE